MIALTDRQFRKARVWSNQELKRIAHLFTGTVANVSAGDDIDKEGGRYQEYFHNTSEYWLTNYAPGQYRGFKGRENEICVDLTVPMDPKLRHRFDVVFNHTTLEHIFDVRTAFANLCNLTSDIVVLVVPFCQVQHENEGYADFWRFTPTCISKMFSDEEFEVVYESANNDFNTSVYCFFVASRHPEAWKGKFPTYVPLAQVGGWVGREPLTILEVFMALARKFVIFANSIFSRLRT